MEGTRTAFISSTSEDLAEHRAAVRKACEDAGFRPVMMENLRANGLDALENSRVLFEAGRDVFIGIYGYRYGTVPKGRKRSVTETEFDWAPEARRRLVFVIDEAHLITIRQVELDDQAQERLRRLKDRVTRNCFSPRFASPHDLREKVRAALDGICREDEAQQHHRVIRALLAALHDRERLQALLRQEGMQLDTEQLKALLERNSDPT